MRPLVPVLTAVLGSGCTGRASAPAVIRIDSAGIEIVTNIPPIDTAPVWVIDSIPRFDIGADQSDPNQELTRPTEPIRMRDGRIVVGSAGHHQIRFYSPDGRWLASIGRQGSGPGEFRQLYSVQAGPDDSLFVETLLRQISVFDGQGRFVRSFAPERPADHASTSVTLAAVLPTNQLLTLVTSPLPPTSPGVQRFPGFLWRHSAGGLPIDSLDTIKGAEWYTEIRGNGYSIMAFPFARRTLTATSGTTLIVVDTEIYGYRTRDVANGRQRFVRIDAPAPPLTKALIEAAIEYESSGWGRIDSAELVAYRTKALAAADRPTMPPIARVTIAANGDVWLEETGALPDRPLRYVVLDSTGAWKGRATGPARFQASWIGNDTVLGLWHDDDDVPHVRIYPLIHRLPAR